MDPDGREYWSSRDLVKVLEYVNYRHFDAVISKAKNACKNSGYSISKSIGL
jgi:DNA-damage-inducible protein D